MKKQTTATVILILGSIFLIQTRVINSIVMFLLIGAVPGMQTLIPSKIMLLITTSLLWLVLISLLNAQLSVKKPQKKVTVKRTVAKRTKQASTRRLRKVEA